MKPTIAALGSTLLLVLAPASAAQDINVDCGPVPVPSSAYGAASGQAGFWNALSSPSPSVFLRDVGGQLTSTTAEVPVACDQYDCSSCGPGACSAFSGSADDFALLGSWFNADCGLSVERVYASGLAPGRYALYLYTYGCPASPAASVQLSINGPGVAAFSTPGAAFQGSWSGFPVGRMVFDFFDGNYLRMDIWGASETGLAGFQLDMLEPTGQVSCLGDGTGAACPCGNFGLPGHGCRNSSTIRGAELGAVGSASLAFDTLGLGCTFEPPGVTSIVLQGDALVAPVRFGDGLRCAGGNLKRLYVASATAAGTLSSPPNGGSSISARSAALGDTIQPGALRVYQVYYRDSDPTFCPAPQGSTFNVSNAVEIVWQN